MVQRCHTGRSRACNLHVRPRFAASREDIVGGTIPGTDLHLRTCELRARFRWVVHAHEHTANRPSSSRNDARRVKEPSTQSFISPSTVRSYKPSSAPYTKRNYIIIIIAAAHETLYHFKDHPRFAKATVETRNTASEMERRNEGAHKREDDERRQDREREREKDV